MLAVLSLIDNLERFQASLRSRLQTPLPGRNAQKRMAPMPRKLSPEPHASPRRSAVLLPLFEKNGTVHILLTVRQMNLNHHGGEIGFPGGAVEPEDIDLVETALRETEEELGLPRENVNVLGKLTPLYIPPSDNLVQPFVGWATCPPSLNPNDIEVARILHVPLDLLLRPETIQRELWYIDQRVLRVPYYQFDNHEIWGATAMIISEFLVIVEQALDRESSQ